MTVMHGFEHRGTLVMKTYEVTNLIELTWTTFGFLPKVNCDTSGDFLVYYQKNTKAVNFSSAVVLITKQQ